MQGLFTAFFAVSLSCIPGVCLLMLLRSVLHKKLAAGVMCMLWAVLCIRLLVPVSISLPKPLVSVPGVEAQQVIITVQDTDKNISQTNKDNNINSIKPDGSANSGKAELNPAMPQKEKEYVFSAPVFFAAVWLFGAVIYGVYLILGRAHLSKLIKRWQNSHLDEWLLRLVRESALSLGMSSKIKLVQCPRIGSPMLTGVLHPCLLLPPKERYSEEQWSFVLRHELMHLKRRDLAMKAVLAAVKCLHWYNPFAWLLCREANRAIELACDSAVVQNREGDYRHKYSIALLDTLAHKPLVPLAFTTYFFDGSKRSLLRRFANISAQKYRTAGAAIATAAVLAAVCLGCTVGVANPAKNEASPSTIAQETLKPPPYSGHMQQNVIIGSKQELYDFAKNLSSGSYPQNTNVELVNDISLEGADWQPIVLGDAETFFIFNGNGKTISNFNVTQLTGNGAGFFSHIAKGSEVKNLKLSGNVEYYSDDKTVECLGIGGFVGLCEGSVANSQFSGKVSGQCYVGGFAGYLGLNANLTLCGSNAIVTGSKYSGGFLGHSGYSSNVEKCWAEGELIAQSYNDEIVESLMGERLYKIAYIGGFSSDTGNFSDCVSDISVLCYDNALMLNSFSPHYISPLSNCYFNIDKNKQWGEDTGFYLEPQRNTPEAVAKGVNGEKIKSLIDELQQKSGV